MAITPISGITIPRRTVETPPGETGLYTKMFDPPKESPMTPELVSPTNPVPEVMQAAGLGTVSIPHTVQLDLMHGMTIPGWNGNPLVFFVFRSKDVFAAKGGSFPAMTVRCPQGAIFHCKTQGHGPPPHTIHWHGIEPTPINDGVGHCSMEIGDYTYQWQPNFQGFYFYHCHRNTVQHFEFGLYGAMIFHTPDSFFASLNPDGTLNTVPIGACTDGKFRVHCNLKTPTDFTALFPGFRGGLNQADFGINNANPWAFTVPYDVEALWVVDDRDSVWSDFAPDPRAFFPKQGKRPGLNDFFPHGFFNDYVADNWFVTGVLVPNAPGVDGTIPTTAAVPAGLNSGVGNTQVAINIPNGGGTGKTVLIRCLDAAYNFARITFPKDVVITACDGRALGVPPFGGTTPLAEFPATVGFVPTRFYNKAFLLPANTPILISTARRFDALMRFAPEEDFTGTAKVEFLDTQSAVANSPGPLLKTAFIPINVNNA